jgi:protein ImuB
MRTLVVVAVDSEVDAAACEAMVAAVEAFTPRVEVVRPGVCACATRGPSRYFGGDDALMAQVSDAVPVACSIGVADGLFAAELAARRRAGVIPPGDTPRFLASFPVDVLADEDHDDVVEVLELVDLFGRLGVRTLGDLAALPATAIVGRFGTIGGTAHRLARGQDVRPLEPPTPPADLVVAAELDPPVERVDMVAFTAKAMADELRDRLLDRALACTRVVVEAETEHGESLSRVWRLDGALSAATLADRVRWQLDGWLSGSAAVRPTSGITLLRLVPDEVVADNGRQLGFWGGDRAADERAARAFARVQGMLGPDAVVTAVVVGGRSPADQTRLVPWGETRDAGDAMPWPGRLPSPSPATVYPVPVSAEVVDDAGEPVGVTGRVAVSAAPARLSIDGGRWTDVIAWAGPWPVDERWWDPPAHRRRARWQLVTAECDAHLLAVEGGRWSLEATYD